MTIQQISSSNFIAIMKSFIEQGISSLGSFTFFFILARWLESERFGQFSAIWISIQVLIGIAMAWVYLPVTSKKVLDEDEISFYGVCARRLMKLLLLVPLLLIPILVITARELLTFPSVLIVILVLCVVVMTVDFLRYYLIRRGHKMATASLVATRWGVSVITVVLLYSMQLLTVQNAVFCMLMGNVMALLVAMFVMKFLKCNIKVVQNNELEQVITAFSKPLLFQALSGAASGVIVAFAMRSWIGTAAYGAYQAMRSICNIISPIMQMVNTHYSTYLTRNKKVSPSRFMECFIIIIGGVLVCISWLLKEFVIENTVGASYLNFSFLLPMVMFHTVIMLASNLLSAHVRHSGCTRIFIYSGLVGFLSGIAIVPVAKCTGSIIMAVSVVIFGSFVQLVMLKRSVSVITSLGL